MRQPRAGTWFAAAAIALAVGLLLVVVLLLTGALLDSADDLVTVCVQHPGENDDNSIDDPLSRWPEGDNGTARPSVVAVWRDGGNIGV